MVKSVRAWLPVAIDQDGERSQNEGVSRWVLRGGPLRADSLAGSEVGQAVGLRIVFAADVRDREFQTPSQLATGPIERIEAGAATGIYPGHLFDHYFRIGIDVQFMSLEQHRTLQGFKKSRIFGDIVVLPADPLGDSERFMAGAINDHSNAGWPRISQRATIDVGHES
jgi:hypothetical protein